MTSPSSTLKLKVSIQYRFFPPLGIYLYTRSRMKSIARRLFNSEFKSFYASAIQSTKLVLGRRREGQFPILIKKNKYNDVKRKFCIFGGFPIRQN